MALSWLGLGQNGTHGVDDSAPPIVQTPPDTLGLRILGPALFEADVDIVAVHGLGGDAFATWTAPNGKLWLRDFLPDQLRNPPDDFKNREDDKKVARMMTFGYNANMFTKAQRHRTFRFAETLLAELRNKRQGAAKTRPLMLIGHSLGGIVIKKALIIAQGRSSQYGDILRSTFHLCFFGTPHQGAASMAGFLRGLGSVLTGAKEESMLRELKLWSSSVIETNSLFVEIADAFSITTFFETEPYHGVLVVDEGSARLNKTKEITIGLDRDHHTMCKFTSVEDTCYRQVFGRLHSEISALGTEDQIREQGQRVQRLLESVPPIPN